jgi:Coenzyme PQQ synthesis protein D (PqqD)
MRLARYVKFREERFGGVLFETRSEKVFALNPTASAIVREIARDGCDEPALIVRLADRYNGSRAAIETEVAAFVGDLRGRGLLED